MKTVHTPEMVAHLWANQSQAVARNSGGSFFFEGPTIYSYGSHFPIARIVEHNGRKVVLFTSRGYSMTTSRHIAEARSACRHLDRVTVYDPRDTPAGSLARLDGEVDELVRRVPEKRKGASQAKAIRELQALLYQRNHLALTFGLAPMRLSPVDFESEIKAIARRETLRVANAKRRATHANKKRLAELVDKYGPLASWPQRWREGHQVPSRYQWESWTGSPMPCLLRPTGDAAEFVQGHKLTTLETSWGVTVPLDHAHRIYRLWARLQGKVPPEGWVNRGDSQEGQVGAFRVDRIDACGTIWAGCHTITADEVRGFGARMGWEGASNA